MPKKKVIIVTDGDIVAKNAVEIAARNIGGRCISFSAGNPTLLSGKQIINLITTAKHNPVVVMVDDRGDKGEGNGERALKEILENKDIEVLGVVAVASNNKDDFSISVNYSIDKRGHKVENAVDKYGNKLETRKLTGDTLSVLSKFRYKIPIIIGLGDPGKMDNNDDASIGSPITTLALKEILHHAKTKSDT